MDELGQEYHRAIDEFLEVAPAERPQLNNPAIKTNGRVASSNDHTGFNPYAHCSVQIARHHKGDMEKWLNFIKQSMNYSIPTDDPGTL